MEEKVIILSLLKDKLSSIDQKTLEKLLKEQKPYIKSKQFISVSSIIHSITDVFDSADSELLNRYMKDALLLQFHNILTIRFEMLKSKHQSKP